MPYRQGYTHLPDAVQILEKPPREGHQLTENDGVSDQEMHFCYKVLKSTRDVIIS